MSKAGKPNSLQWNNHRVPPCRPPCFLRLVAHSCASLLSVHTALYCRTWGLQRQRLTTQNCFSQSSESFQLTSHYTLAKVSSVTCDPFILEITARQNIIWVLALHRLGLKSCFCQSVTSSKSGTLQASFSLSVKWNDNANRFTVRIYWDQKVYHSAWKKASGMNVLYYHSFCFPLC